MSLLVLVTAVEQQAFLKEECLAQPQSVGLLGAVSGLPQKLVRIYHPLGIMCSCTCGRHSSEKAVGVDQGRGDFASLALWGL